MSAPSSRANSDTAQVRGSKLTSSPPPFSHLFHFLRRCAQSLQFCPTSCDLMDCSLPNSSVHGIFQARILEWVVRPSSRASSQHRDQTWVSCIAGGFFSPEPPGEPLSGGGNSFQVTAGTRHGLNNTRMWGGDWQVREPGAELIPHTFMDMD